MSRLQRWIPLAALLLLAGCGAGADKGEPSSGPASAGPVVLDVTIIKGEVSPRGARVNLEVGQPLTLSIHSDVPERIHVHTDPEKTFRVKAGGQQRVTFSVDRPGKVAVEVHHLDVVIAEVLVRK